MFCNNKDAVHLDIHDFDVWDSVTGWLQELCDDMSLQSAIVVKPYNKHCIDLLAVANLPKEQLGGGYKDHLLGLFQECVKYTSKVHTHKLPHPLAEIFSKVTGDDCSHVFFFPFVVSNESFAIICFPNEKEAQLSQELTDELGDIVLLACEISKLEETSDRLKTLEIYVREVGHDFASSVQATVTQLRNISKGRYPEELIKEKAAQAEEEIWSAYRNAANLGLVVETDYKVENSEYINLSTEIRKVVAQYQSEARERHIEIEPLYPQGLMNVRCDPDAISTAVGHYLLNAIKYAFGSSKIQVKLEESGPTVNISVKNKGPLIDDSESVKIWRFGFRGRKSYERHVNGSGIGLFTVKKIVEAHGGTAGFANHGDEHVYFSLTIPKDGNFGGKVL